jgi:hypothetical protein
VIPVLPLTPTKNVNSNNFNFQPKSRETSRNRDCSKMLISRFLVVSRDFDRVYVFVGVYGSSAGICCEQEDAEQNEKKIILGSRPGVPPAACKKLPTFEWLSKRCSHTKTSLKL